jgi:electron transfer flavoprotein alpha subunit
VRPGVLSAARPDAARRARIETLAVPAAAARVRVVAAQPLAAQPAALDAAEIVLGVGRGIGGPAALAPVLALAARLGAAVAATREVTDAGWLPKQHQVGVTGRAIAPRLYVALAVSGAMEHLVGLRRAGIVVAVNKNPKAQMLKAADLGIVADYAALLPHLEAALRA